MWTKTEDYRDVTGSRTYASGWVPEEKILESRADRSTRSENKPILRYIIFVEYGDDGVMFRGYCGYKYRKDQAYAFDSLDKAKETLEYDLQHGPGDGVTKAEIWSVHVVPMASMTYHKLEHEEVIDSVL